MHHADLLNFSDAECTAFVLAGVYTTRLSSVSIYSYSCLDVNDGSDRVTCTRGGFLLLGNGMGPLSSNLDLGGSGLFGGSGFLTVCGGGVDLGLTLVGAGGFLWFSVVLVYLLIL